ncbi:MAG: Ig-like domain-containing protein, partial [Gorillibacterium sp.]|nr:Ig-like domain-containing protein [Gorillibacterium sp.]
MMKKTNKLLSGLLACVLVLGGQVTAFAAAGSAYETLPNNSLLVQYDFNETSGTIAHDTSGHGYDGVLSSGATWKVEGKNYGAVSLDGTANGYVTIPNGVLNGVHNVTVTANVYLRTGANGFITGLGTDTSKYVYLKTSGEGGLKTSKGDEHFQASALLNNVWTHFALVVDSVNKTQQLYINGTLLTSKAITGDPSEIYNASKSLSGYIGKSFWSDPYVNEMVDNYRVYGSALTASQISALATMTVNTSTATDSYIGTTPGTAPILPGFVKLTNSDGTTQNMPVTWDPIDSSKYQSPGTFDATGHLNSAIPVLTTTAHVAVMAKPLLSSDAKSKTTISLKWAGISNATSYQIYRSATSGSGYQKVYDGQATEYVDLELNKATTYYYVLTGSIGQVQSVYSNELAIKTDTEITAAPIGLAQNLYKFPYRTQFTWGSVPLAETYNIYRSDSVDG